MDLGQSPEACMKYIAHRGNIDGPKPELENTPAYIQHALDAGFYVELDVWEMKGLLWLGHDAPSISVSPDFFRGREWKLFCHCKNVGAISLLHRLGCPSYFFHEDDPYTITSNGFVWCYPYRTPPSELAIVVMPEQWIDLPKFGDYAERYHLAGVCSDYVSILKA